MALLAMATLNVATAQTVVSVSVQADQENRPTRPYFTTPTYISGETQLQDFYQQHLIYPAQAKKISREGTVLLKVQILADGTVGKIHVKQALGAGCDQEAIRVTRLLPGWLPARAGNRKVNAYVYIPIDFKLY